MEITNVRYVDNQNYPELWLDIDGRTAKLDAYQKTTLLNAGFVSLGTDWSELMPVFEYNGTRLFGFTDNSEVLRLYKEFRRYTNRGGFKEQVIPYP